MAKPFFHNPVPVGDVVTGLLDPVMRKRAGISVGLVQSWDEIVGPRLGATSRPHKIQWPRRGDDDDAFEPAVLVIACEGAAALHIQHETAEIIGRVNAFLGFNAIGRIRIVQRPVRVAARPAQSKPAPLSQTQAERLSERVSAIEDEELRASLERLGRAVLGTRSSKRR
jgi:hypothetical protein